MYGIGEKRFENISCASHGEIIISDWLEDGKRKVKEGKEMLKEAEIEHYGCTDLCRYWLCVHKEDAEKAKQILGIN